MHVADRTNVVTVREGSGRRVLNESRSNETRPVCSAGRTHGKPGLPSQPQGPRFSVSGIGTTRSWKASRPRKGQPDGVQDGRTAEAVRRCWSQGTSRPLRTPYPVTQRMRRLHRRPRTLASASVRDTRRPPLPARREAAGLRGRRREGHSSVLWGNREPQASRPRGLRGDLPPAADRYLFQRLGGVRRCGR